MRLTEVEQKQFDKQKLKLLSQAGRKEGRQAGRQRDRKAGRQEGRQAGRQEGRKEDRETGRQAGRKAGRKARRKTGRQEGRQVLLRQVCKLCYEAHAKTNETQTQCRKILHRDKLLHF